MIKHAIWQGKGGTLDRPGRQHSLVMMKPQAVL